MTQSDLVGIVEVGMWAGFWIAIVQHYRQKGRGGLFRHLAGFLGGGFLTLGLFTALFFFGVMPDHPKTFNLTPEQYAKQLNPLLEEWEHRPQVDPTNISEQESYDLLKARLDPYTTVFAAISKYDGKIYRIYVEGQFNSDLNAFKHMTRLASAALAATQKDAVTADVYEQMGDLADGKTVVLGDASLTFELKRGVGMKFLADPL